MFKAIGHQNQGKEESRLWRFWPIVFLFVLGWGIIPLRGQKVTTEVRVLDDLFLTKSGLIPPPVNSIELEREFTISIQQSTSFVGLASDIDGNIYVSLGPAGIVQKCSARGELLLILGRKPNGKPFLREPSGVRASSGLLAVHDLGRASIEVFDPTGIRLRGQKVTECGDFALDDDGRFFVAQAIQDPSTPLVKALEPGGKGFAFGKPLPLPHSLAVLNSRSLARNDEGEIFVAFVYFPVVRRYSSTGTLKAEYRLESPVIKAKQDFNLRLIGEGVANPSRRAGFRAVTLKAKSLGERVYLLSVQPRLEITEMDDQGRQGTTFWQDRVEISDDCDFDVVRVANELKFYVAHPSPQGTDIDVFRKKVRREGPRAEIEELSDEIHDFPENPLNYINRGVAKHRQGDYSGAIKDFSRAIELDPHSALGFKNRGLSRMKVEDLTGAIGDFTKALEIGPNDSSAFFSRGIALVRSAEYGAAIKDFERAALLDPKMKAKSREQIEYCRSRLKFPAAYY